MRQKVHEFNFQRVCKRHRLMLSRKMCVARQIQHIRDNVVHGLICALNCANCFVFVWDRGKDTNSSFIVEPVSCNGSHKLIVGSDNLEDFASRSDPLVKFIQMSK